MKKYFLFAAKNLNIFIQKMPHENAHFMDDTSKTRSIKYLNVETRLLFAPHPVKISG